MGTANAVLAIIVGVAAGLPVAFVLASLGLMVHEPFMLLVGSPVTIVWAGVAAAVAAGWVSNAAARDGKRAHMPRAILHGLRWTVPASVLFGLLLMARAHLGGVPLGFILAPIALGACAMAGAQALREREAPGRTRRDLMLTAGVVVGVMASFFLLLGGACLVEMCGA